MHWAQCLWLGIVYLSEVGYWGSHVTSNKWNISDLTSVIWHLWSLPRLWPTVRKLSHLLFLFTSLLMETLATSNMLENDGFDILLWELLKPSLGILSHIASSVCLTSTSMCMFLFIWLTHSSLDSLLHLWWILHISHWCVTHLNVFKQLLKECDQGYFAVDLNH